MTGPAEQAMADQLAAAVDHLQVRLDALVTEHGYAPGTARDDPWLLDLVIDAAGLRAGPPRLCPHVLAMRGPQPVYLAPATRRIACQPCHAQDIATMATTDEDFTCDRCRVIPADGRLAFAVMGVGPVLIHLGLCTACLPAIHAEAS